MTELPRKNPMRLAEISRLKTEAAFLENRLEELDRDLEQRGRTLHRIIAGLTNERDQARAKLTRAKQSLESLTA